MRKNNFRNLCHLLLFGLLVSRLWRDRMKWSDKERIIFLSLHSYNLLYLSKYGNIREKDNSLRSYNPVYNEGNWTDGQTDGRIDR